MHSSSIKQKCFSKYTFQNTYDTVVISLSNFFYRTHLFRNGLQRNVILSKIISCNSKNVSIEVWWCKKNFWKKKQSFCTKKQDTLHYIVGNNFEKKQTSTSLNLKSTNIATLYFLLQVSRRRFAYSVQHCENNQHEYF